MLAEDENGKDTWRRYPLFTPNSAKTPEVQGCRIA
jgi:hypothetical protein